MRKIIIIIIILTTALSIVFSLFQGSNLIIYNDYPYYFNNAFQLLYSWSDSFLGLQQSQNHGLLIAYFFTNILLYLGLHDASITHILFYVPIVVLFCTGCYIGYYYSKKRYVIIFAGFFAVGNNFVFEQYIVFPTYSIINLIGLYWLIHCLYVQTIQHKIKPFFYLLPLLFFHPFRFVCSIIASWFWVILFGGSKKTYIGYIIFTIISVLLNAYRFVPLGFMIGFDNNEFYNNNLSVVLDGYASWTNIIKNILFLNYGLLGNNLNISAINYLFYFLFFGFVIYHIFFVNREDKHINIKLFLMFFIFINLGLGGNSPITGLFFDYGLQYIPGFDLFRSYTRFAGVAISLSLLIVILTIKNRYTYIYGTILLLFSNINFYQSSYINGLIASFNIPHEYNEIKSKISGNILIYPNSLYEAYSRSLNQNNVTYPQMLYFQKLFFNIVTYNSAEKNLLGQYDTFSGAFNYYNNFDFDIVNLSNIFKKIPHNYVLIHKDLVDITCNNKKVDPLPYIKLFDELADIYHKVVDNKYFTVYKNKYIYQTFNSRDNAYIFTKINPTKYSLSLTLPANSTGDNLKFLQSFHHERKLYPGQPIDDCSRTQTYNSYAESGSYQTGLTHTVGSGQTWETIVRLYGSQTGYLHRLNQLTGKILQSGQVLQIRPEVYPEMVQTSTGTTTECIQSGYTFFQGEELSYLWKEPLWNSGHQLVYDYANGWKIDLHAPVTSGSSETYLDRGLREGWITRGPDGSYQVYLTLYFRPQSRFYLGLMISVTTFLSLLGWLAWDRHRGRQKREEKKNSGNSLAKE